MQRGGQGQRERWGKLGPELRQVLAARGSSSSGEFDERAGRARSVNRWPFEWLLALPRVYADEFAARDNADRTRAMLDRAAAITLGQ